MERAAGDLSNEPSETFDLDTPSISVGGGAIDNRHVAAGGARPSGHRPARGGGSGVRAMDSAGALPAPALVACTRAHAAELACLDLAEGRALLATGGGDGELRLWQWRAGAGWLEAGRAPRAHRFGVSAARWAAAGALLATGGVEGAARLWAGGAAGPRCVATLAWPGACSVRALCWTGGGALATGHDDGAVLVWGAAGALLARLAGGAAHAGAVHALAAAADGALLLSGCTEGRLRVFRLAELVSLGSSGADAASGGAAAAAGAWQEEAHDMGVLCAAAAGRELATGGQDARVRTWRCARGGALAARAALAGHAGAVTALRWARGGRVLASASLDRSARLWAPRAGVCLHALPAHPRYLTCAALAAGAGFLITGSNDRTFRTWSLGALALHAELRAPCDALAHFALGDLEGIELLKMDEEGSSRRTTAEREEGEEEEEADESAGEALCEWQLQAHAGAINCIAARGALLATASSDGSVKVWRWAGSSAAEAEGGGAGGGGGEEVAALYLEHTLAAHRYPALAAEFGASGAGAVLLSAGLDGDAVLWDVETGVQIRALSVPGGSGGGVRGARLSRERPPRALLATDDGLAPLWSTAQADPRPERVYAGLAEAATCCAWAEDAALCAVGGAGGELLLLAPPAAAPALALAQAHDLGVTSCDFAPTSLAPEGGYLLATVGNDSLIKLWEMWLSEDGSARCRLAHAAAAHGGCAYSVRWGEGGVLASAGDDGWARAWRLERGEAAAAPRLAAVGGVHCAGGCVAALVVRGGLLCSGGARGVLALWRVGAAERGEEEGERGARLWRGGGVERWVREQVCGAPGAAVPARRGAALAAAARRLTGAALLDAPLEEVLAALGLGEEEEEEEEEERARVRAVLTEELRWLRRAPPSAALEARAAHALLCPLSHRLLRWPTRAADGFTYERENILEWLLAAPPEGAVSPVSGRRLRNLQLAPNYRLLAAVRAFVRDEGEEEEEEEEEES